MRVGRGGRGTHDHVATRGRDCRWCWRARGCRRAYSAATAALPLSATRGQLQLSTARREAEIKNLEHWQRVNTAIYWHLRPSIDIEGPDYLMNLRKIESLYNMDLADGRELARWALRAVDVTSKTLQLKLHRGLLKASLPEGASATQLKAHAQKLLQVWLLLEQSDPNDCASLAELYEYLVLSMPPRPEGSHLTNLRTWIAMELTSFRGGTNPSMQDFDATINRMVDHGVFLGLPPGEPVAETSLNLMAGDGDLFCTTCSESDGPTLLALNGEYGTGGNGNKGPGGVGTRPENDCDFCSSFYCQSRKKGGKEKCICRHNSRFDVSKLSRGGKGYVLANRVHHQANPDITTLKGVRLTIRKGNSGEAGAQSSGNQGAIALISGHSLKRNAWSN